MSKLKLFLTSPYFWIRFILIGGVVVLLETFFLGLWALPIINYRVAYMTEISVYDYLFVGAFAALFAFGATIFLLAKRFGVSSCAVGSGGGILGIFTMLCPVCPVFFLTYFGVSASLIAIAPYFWWFRLAAGLLLIIGIIILLSRLEISKLPVFNKAAFAQAMLIFLVAVSLFVNQALAMEIGENLLGPQPGEKIELSGDFANDVAALVTPATISFYGPELSLDFSNVATIEKSIAILSKFAPQQGSKPIKLTSEEMKRYIKIGTKPTVACEFCCGAKTLVTDDGSPTCGCAHSVAMRGTIAYLIRNYSKMSDAEISYEIVRQKGLYFPKQMQERMAKQLAGDSKNFTPDIAFLTQNLKKGELFDLQKKAKSSGFKPDAKGADMVGGC